MSKKLKVNMVEVAIDMLEPNPWNTNVVSPEHESKLEESVRRFGVFKPVIVRELEGGGLQILGGEHRWSAARRLGHKTVPIVNLGDISDDKAKEIGLADNGRYGQDDPMGLSALLKEMGNTDELATFLPYSDIDFASILSVESISLDDLDIDDDESLSVLSPPSTPNFQVMRFKIPVEDQAWIAALIEHEMRAGGFTKEDSMSNAGMAFVSIMRRVKEGK